MKITKWMIICLTFGLVACSRNNPVIHEPMKSALAHENDMAFMGDQPKAEFERTADEFYQEILKDAEDFGANACIRPARPPDRHDELNEEPPDLLRASPGVFAIFGAQALETVENTLDKRCELVMLSLRGKYSNRDKPLDKQGCEEQLKEWGLFRDEFMSEIMNIFYDFWAYHGVGDSESNLDETLSGIHYGIPYHANFLSNTLEQAFYQPPLTSPPRLDFPQGPCYTPLGLLNEAERYVFFRLHVYFKTELHAAFTQYIENHCRLVDGRVECDDRAMAKEMDKWDIEKIQPSASEIEFVFKAISEMPGYQGRMKRESPVHPPGDAEGQSGLGEP